MTGIRAFWKAVRSIFDPVRAVYVGVALATGYHTAWGAAVIMQGQLPAGALPQVQVGWWLQGLLFAIGVDFSMFVIAGRLRHRGKTLSESAILIVAFIVTALASSYFQLVYAFNHAGAISPGAGVSPYWQGVIQPLMDAGVVFAAVLLPVIAVLYALADIAQSDHARPEPPAQETKTYRASITASVTGWPRPNPPRPEVRREDPPLIEAEVPVREPADHGGLLCVCGKVCSSTSGLTRHQMQCAVYQESLSVEAE